MPLNFAALLPYEAVIPRFIARDKKQALRLLAAEAKKSTPLSEREIFSVLMAREQVGSTAMGGGVCIPHGRFDELKEPRAFFAKLDKPIPFAAADGRPVDMIFLLLTPVSANTDHIKALAVISRLMRDKHLCENLRSINDATILHDLLVVAADDAA